MSNHWLYQGLAEPPPAALAQAEVVTLDKWYQPPALPRGKRAASASHSFAVAPLYVPEQLVDPVVLAPLATPTIRARRALLVTWSIAPVFTPEDPANRLASIEIAQPQPSRKRRAESGSTEPLYVEPAAELVALDWLAAPPQPRARSRRLPDPTAACDSPLSVLEIPEAITIDKWLPAIMQPGRRKRGPVPLASVLVDIAALDTLTLDQWFAPLATPLVLPRLRPLGESCEPVVASPAAAGLTSAGRVWIVSARGDVWEEPVRPADWIPNERRSNWEEPTS
jgi:hypothetical protein